MVPIHESDVAENRWKDDEWRQFELWERIEYRLRRRRTWIIAAVALTFIAILAGPIIQDRTPKWRALGAMRALAMKANQMKVDSASLGVPLRLHLRTTAEGPEFLVERVEACLEKPAPISENRIWGGGKLIQKREVASEFVVLTPENASSLGLERVVTSLCFDPMKSEAKNATQAVGILSVKDLAVRRTDRVAFMNFSGLFAEIDFD